MEHGKGVVCLLDPTRPTLCVIQLEDDIMYSSSPQTDLYTAGDTCPRYGCGGVVLATPVVHNCLVCSRCNGLCTRSRTWQGVELDGVKIKTTAVFTSKGVTSSPQTRSSTGVTVSSTPLVAYRCTGGSQDSLAAGVELPDHGRRYVVASTEGDSHDEYHHRHGVYPSDSLKVVSHSTETSGVVDCGAEPPVSGSDVSNNPHIDSQSDVDESDAMRGFDESIQAAMEELEALKHDYDPALGVVSKAFRKAINRDRKRPRAARGRSRRSIIQSRAGGLDQIHAISNKLYVDVNIVREMEAAWHTWHAHQAVTGVRHYRLKTAEAPAIVMYTLLNRGIPTCPYDVLDSERCSHEASRRIAWDKMIQIMGKVDLPHINVGNVLFSLCCRLSVILRYLCTWCHTACRLHTMLLRMDNRDVIKSRVDWLVDHQRQVPSRFSHAAAQQSLRSPDASECWRGYIFSTVVEAACALVYTVHLHADADANSKAGGTRPTAKAKRFTDSLGPRSWEDYCRDVISLTFAFNRTAANSYRLYLKTTHRMLMHV